MASPFSLSTGVLSVRKNRQKSDFLDAPDHDRRPDASGMTGIFASDEDPDKCKYFHPEEQAPRAARTGHHMSLIKTDAAK
jgi:hypothetical protein